MVEVTSDHTGLRVLPPVLFVVALGLGALLHWLWPFRFLPEIARFSAGPLLIAASIAVMPWVFRAFRRAETPYDVRRAARALVTSGPFRYSRNPGYVALIVFAVGVALVADNIWMLIATTLATVYLHRRVVLAEERHLQARFGEPYRLYKRRVRRWV